MHVGDQKKLTAVLADAVKLRKFWRDRIIACAENEFSSALGRRKTAFKPMDGRPSRRHSIHQSAAWLHDFDQAVPPVAAFSNQMVLPKIQWRKPDLAHLPNKSILSYVYTQKRNSAALGEKRNVFDN